MRPSGETAGQTLIPADSVSRRRSFPCMFTEQICCPPGAESVKTTRLPSGANARSAGRAVRALGREDRFGVCLFIANDQQHLRTARRFAVGVPAAVARIRRVELMHEHRRIEQLLRAVCEVEPHRARRDWECCAPRRQFCRPPSTNVGANFSIAVVGQCASVQRSPSMTWPPSRTCIAARSAVVTPASSSIVVPTMAGVTGFGQRKLAVRVAFADDATRLHAAAGPDRKVALVPMVARGDVVDPRRAAEFSHADDQRRLQQSAVAQVVEQRREDSVQAAARASRPAARSCRRACPSRSRRTDRRLRRTGSSSPARTGRPLRPAADPADSFARTTCARTRRASLPTRGTGRTPRSRRSNSAANTRAGRRCPISRSPRVSARRRSTSSSASTVRRSSSRAGVSPSSSLSSGIETSPLSEQFSMNGSWALPHLPPP